MLIGIFFFFKIFMTIKILINLNTAVHERMLKHVLSSLIRFFDKLPSAQILNRFSGDMGILDKNNWNNVFDFVDGFFYISSFLLYLCIVAPLMLLPILAISYCLYKAKGFFSKSCLALTKLDLALRSPLYSEFSSLLHGLNIVRIYG
mmetsp:Transcript_22401/g.19304  ORF Transcript_22401/g.19304 Transcript_22401/m.19304 type:complete len:147 (+) Transcript_22401:2-442(+)